MRRISACLLGATLALGATAGAHAGITTYNVSFTASDFTSEFGQPVPTDPVTGSFQITLDPSLSYTDDTADITGGAINIALGSAFSFTYFAPVDPTPPPMGFDPGELVVGGIEDTALSVQISPQTDDFWLHILNFSTVPTYQQVGYAQTAIEGENLFDTTSGSVEVSLVTPSVPEPSTWAMMLVGFAGLGYAAYRRRTVAATA